MSTSAAEPPQAGADSGQPAPDVRPGLSRRAMIGGTAAVVAGVSLAGVAAFRLRRRTLTFQGATGWLNTEPLRLSELRGHVVLVDFWALTCINWVRTAPYVRAWAQAYRGDGLVVVGVHTPEFSFEHDMDRVRRSVLERAIDYPVAVDNDYEIWDAFHNNYWPALHLLDKDGSVAYDHFGEGDYEAAEKALQQTLGVERDLVTITGEGVEAQADWPNLRTPETYLGYGRSHGFASSSDPAFDRRGSYELPAHLPYNTWALDGEWVIGSEKIKDVGETGGSIAYRFHARDVHLVMTPGVSDPIRFRVLLDGQPPGPSHGVDIDEDGNGLLSDGRLYQLIRERGTVGERVLQIIFDSAGSEAYAFTFG